jgi:hypothetical protein
MKAASDGEGGVRGFVVSSEPGELGFSVLMILPGEGEHVLVAGEDGVHIVQKRKIVGEGMMKQFVDAFMALLVSLQRVRMTRVVV